MARITVSDSLQHVPNRFALVVLAAHRAKEIALGAPKLLSLNKKRSEKVAVEALREIAAGLLDVGTLYNSVVKKYQRRLLLRIDDKPNTEDMEISSLFGEEIGMMHQESKRVQILKEDASAEEESKGEELGYGDVESEEE